MFDLSTLAVADTGFLHLKGPDGAYLNDEAGKPRGVELYSPGSSQAAAVEERQSARVLKRLADNDGKPSLAPLSERRAQDAEDLAALTVRLVNFDYPGGAAALYADPRMGWVNKQVIKGKDDWGNFKPGSAAN